MNAVDATTLTGAAGEHLVMSRLLSRGYIAALAPQGVPHFDIVVTSMDGATLYALQVKTRWDKGGDGGWHMRKKHEHLSDPHMFYCFVDLSKNTAFQPSVYVMPSEVVASAVRESHSVWLKNPGHKGQERRDSDMRRLLPDYSRIMGTPCLYPAGWMDGYLENWGQLKA